MLISFLQTATRVLSESAGVNMNTWIVGRTPVAHYVQKPVFESDRVTVKSKGSKTFFLKGRIMAGQADLSGNTHGLSDFKWLTKAELEEHLSTDYFWKVRGMMADR
jgi:large subunit ribosomal protein L46